MTGTITPRLIRKTNRQLIFDYIYGHGRVSQQDIITDLRLSRPTVAAGLSELEAKGFIYKDGIIDHEQTGRKAAAYRTVSACRIGIGAEITEKTLTIVAADLFGTILAHRTLPMRYENIPAYYPQAAEALMNFIHDNHFTDEQVLGIGFAVQALVTADGKSVFYGEILGCTGLTIDVFARYLPYPCMFIHDADSAGLSELWVRPGLRNAVYLSLSRHLGAAMILAGEVRPGKHGHSATFEHIQREPGGRRCYCGRQGCLETLCSLEALLGEQEAGTFFAGVRSGRKKETGIWQKYLRDLAEAVADFHLVMDEEFILGGHLAPYLKPEDIDYMYEVIRQRSPFAEEEDFLQISRIPEYNIPAGAALPYIRRFLEDIESS